MLNQVKGQTDAHNQKAALKGISNVRQSWLSVEGKVVSQSSQIYNQSERDLVIVNAMIQNKDYHSASSRLSNMIKYLSPLALEKGYSMWDAAMIPVREGLEALLVVGALLAFVKKTNEGKGKGWIWSGVSLGIGLSALLAIIVKFVFKSGAFGDNNFLIAGITGLFAAIMLLYMSYWLHSKSNIAEWNRYIKAKSQAALTSGSLISLGFLSFLAVFREGTETVLFVIGMVNQISLQNLFLGLLVGLGILAVIAILMFVVGIKLPIRPFFMVSSLIIFYLCLKFTGLGIHSLQLAGVLPTTLASHFPSISFIAFFPTWESMIPQFILLIFALSVLMLNRSKRRKISN
jgi:high-affinity iron transporter